MQRDSGLAEDGRKAGSPFVLPPSRAEAWRRNLRLAVFGPFARKVIGLSALTAAGQLSFVVALPVLADFIRRPISGYSRSTCRSSTSAALSSA